MREKHSVSNTKSSKDDVPTGKVAISSQTREKTMFTLGDIRNIAIQIEKNGEKTYREASLKSSNSDTAETLRWMADQEKRHMEWFSKLKAKKELSGSQKELEQMGKNLLQDMVKDNPFLLTPDELLENDAVEEVLKRSTQFEEDTIVFYQFLLEFLDDQETIEQMHQIIKEEQGHIRQLELLLDSAAGVEAGNNLS